MHFASELGDSRTESTVLSSVCEHIVDCTLFYSRSVRVAPGTGLPRARAGDGARTEVRGAR